MDGSGKYTESLLNSKLETVLYSNTADNILDRTDEIYGVYFSKGSRFVFTSYICLFTWSKYLVQVLGPSNLENERTSMQQNLKLLQKHQRCWLDSPWSLWWKLH